jgi:hypothetical protein
LGWLWTPRSRRLVIAFLLVIAVLIIIDFVGILAFILPRYSLLVFAIVLFILMITIADRWDLF